MNNTIWHPFTQMKTAAEPIHVVSAKDCTLYADDGKTYIDAIASWWVNVHGHCNKFIADAIAEQANTLEHIIFAGFTHTPAIDLADGLKTILPNHFSKIFYSDNGSTSVEVALKMALQYWHNQGNVTKTKVIAFHNSYHGDTFGAMSVGAKNAFNAAFENHLFQVDFIETPNKNNIDRLINKLNKLVDNDDVAAFIFEPLVQGANGMLMYDAELLDQLIAIAQSKNVICIADEVMTGFGRTGKNFAIEYLHQKVDIVCLSKGITGGFLPLGVTACTQQIFDAFYSNDSHKTFFHGHSYTANPLACAAANASLKLLMSNECQAQISGIAQSHQKFIETIIGDDCILDIRQQGTILAIELRTPEATSYFNSIITEVYKFCLSEGVVLRPLGNVLYVMPPYCITEIELETVYGVIVKLLHHLKK